MQPLKELRQSFEEKLETVRKLIDGFDENMDYASFCSLQGFAEGLDFAIEELKKKEEEASGQ
jgi:hypothetical protein